MSDEVHTTVTAATPYAEGGVFEASAFARGDKWTNFWEDENGVAAESQKYVTVEGDTIESVSEVFYGHSGGVGRIREANPGLIEPLAVGTDLTILPE